MYSICISSDILNHTNKVVLNPVHGALFFINNATFTSAPFSVQLKHLNSPISQTRDVPKNT